MADNVSTEVALVGETKQCRACSWFWGRELPYGPFPTYDFKTPLPREARRALPLIDSAQHWLEAKATPKFEQIDPAILHGCRKAPIMTLGINPNMTGFFTGAEAARAAYPSFADAKSYAYYYRHRSVFQERLTAEALDKHWRDAGTPVLAEKSGVTMGVRRGNSRRWAAIDVLYDDGQRDVVELTWNADSVPVIFAARDQPFAAGAVLAAVRAEPPAGALQLMAAPEDYYGRFQSVLTRLCELAGWPAELRVGEDVAMGDMVACASPGWDSARYDIPVDRIADTCAGSKRFILRQVLQTQPRVLVLVGKTALRMFAEYMPAQPWLARLADRYRDDTFGLFRETIDGTFELDLHAEGIELRARVLCVPHFSYDDNYARQLQLSEAEWSGFAGAHSADAGVLRDAGLVRPPRDGNIAIDFVAPESLRGKLTAQGLRVLMAYYFDPIEMIARTLHQEVKRGRLNLEPGRTRLQRAAGGCDFCHNERWQFEEGCDYPSARAPSVPNTVSLEYAQRLGRPEPAGSPPDAVRVWLGVRRKDLSADSFADKLKTMFVPATVQMLQPLGLTAYLPTLLGDHSASDLPHELALVFYASQRAYNESRDTPTGRAYAALHGIAFESGASRSSFPVAFRGRLDNATAYHLYTQPAAWQTGSTEVCVARLASPSSVAALTTYLAQLQQHPENGLDGYIFTLVGDLWLRWAHFIGARRDSELLHEPGLGAPIHASRSVDHRLALDDLRAPISAVPLEPGSTLNMQFRPR